MSRGLAPFVALALVALMGAGCGSSADSGTGSGSGGGAQKDADRDTLVKFSACMRENGVADFPDPTADGDFDYGITVSGEVWTKALDACKDLRPAGSFSGNRTPEQQAAGLRFAQCIRENGVKDFPDPANGDPLVDTTKIPSTNRKGGMTILNAAMRKCGDIAAAAMDKKP
jgi:hypothetical protein